MQTQETQPERKIRGFLGVLPAFKRVRDNIIPTGPNLDNYIRPYFPLTGEIMYSAAPIVPVELVDLKPFKRSSFDENFEAIFKRKPAISPRLRNSFVRIQIEVLDGNGVLAQNKVISGCLITNKHVFTCDEAFVDIPAGHKIGSIMVKDRSGTLSEGFKVNIDKFLEAAQTHKMVTSNSLRYWGLEKGKDPRLEFAVIQLIKPFAYSVDELVAIPDVPTWSEGTALLSLGFPTRPDPILGPESFHFLFQNSMRLWDIEKRRDVVKRYVDATFNQLPECAAMACFGSTLGESRVEVGYYSLTDMSILYGCTGGPVVSLERPDELIGIMIGSWAITKMSLFLDVQTPVVRNLNEMCRAETSVKS